MIGCTELLFECVKTMGYLGYLLIDVPYYVSKEVSELTKPDWSDDLHHSENLVYVGSGEQSFLEMIKTKQLSHGRYMCLTPCFRNEPELDILHLKMFLKLELIDYLDTDDEDYARKTLDNMMFDMLNFYQHYLPKYHIEKSEVIKDQFDILLDGVEIGSYGIRKTLGGELYVYGTGVALPRLNVAIAMA